MLEVVPDYADRLHEYTADLIDLLNVLGRLVALEPAQAALLDAVLAGRRWDQAALSEAGALAAAEPPAATEVEKLPR